LLLAEQVGGALWFRWGHFLLLFLGVRYGVGAHPDVGSGGGTLAGRHADAGGDRIPILASRQQAQNCLPLFLGHCSEVGTGTGK
jgi:hypothetical protein